MNDFTCSTYSGSVLAGRLGEVFVLFDAAQVEGRGGFLPWVTEDDDLAPEFLKVSSLGGHQLHQCRRQELGS